MWARCAAELKLVKSQQVRSMAFQVRRLPLLRLCSPVIPAAPTPHRVHTGLGIGGAGRGQKLPETHENVFEAMSGER